MHDAVDQMCAQISELSVILATHGQSVKAFSSCQGLILSRVYSEGYVQKKTLAKK